jgi:hypothetical protein
MKKMLYILFLSVFFSSFLIVSAQYNISVRLGAYCEGVGLVYSPSTPLTEGNTYSVSDWTLPSGYASVQPLFNALIGSTFVIESGALTEDIQVDWILYNINCSNGKYLPNGSVTETVFNGYFVVSHLVGGTWTQVEPYNFVSGKYAVLSLKNTLAFQNLLNSIMPGGAGLLGFYFYGNSEFNSNGLTFTSPDPITDVNQFWVIKAAHFSQIVGGNKNQVTGINDHNNSIPSVFGLSQNYPNPFNPSTIIEYSLPQKSNVEISVYNILGIKVATIVKSTKEAGSYKVEFNGAELGSGLYIYELKTDKTTISRKMLLLK